MISSDGSLWIAQQDSEGSLPTEYLANEVFSPYNLRQSASLFFLGGGLRASGYFINHNTAGIKKIQI